MEALVVWQRGESRDGVFLDSFRGCMAFSLRLPGWRMLCLRVQGLSLRLWMVSGVEAPLLCSLLDVKALDAGHQPRPEPN